MAGRITSRAVFANATNMTDSSLPRTPQNRAHTLSVSIAVGHLTSACGCSGGVSASVPECSLLCRVEFRGQDGTNVALFGEWHTVFVIDDGQLNDCLAIVYHGMVYWAWDLDCGITD